MIKLLPSLNSGL